VKITKRRKLAMLVGVWEHIAVKHGRIGAGWKGRLGRSVEDSKVAPIEL
jgi:hypothetical protein